MSEEGSDVHDLEETDDTEVVESAETGTESENGSSSPGASSLSGHLDPSEWIEFNKKIISMRPLYKSAKVQFVNKLSRQIKTLRLKKGSPQQVEKSRRKADRLVEEIAYVKRLKTDIVPKFAVLHSKEEVGKIMNSAESSLEYRVKAKVAFMPVISRAADAYHADHPGWRETLFKLIQMAGKKMKKKRRQIRGKDPKKKEKPSAIVRPQLPKNSFREDSGRFAASNFPEPPPGFRDPDRIDSSNDNNSTSTCESNDDESVSESLQFSGSSQSLLNSDVEEGTSADEVIDLGRNFVKRESLGKRRGSLAGKPTAQKTFLKRSASNDKSPVNGNKKNNRNSTGSGHVTNTEYPVRDSERDVKNVAADQDHNVDPFFMTSDNKEYKTIWKVEPADSFKNKNAKEPEFMFKNARPFDDLKTKKGVKRSSTAVLPYKDKISKAKTIPPENLHPSWQAKKKLNVATALFQGKKIVFDDA